MEGRRERERRIGAGRSNGCESIPMLFQHGKEAARMLLGRLVEAAAVSRRTASDSSFSSRQLTAAKKNDEETKEIMLTNSGRRRRHALKAVHTKTSVGGAEQKTTPRLFPSPSFPSVEPQPRPLRPLSPCRLRDRRVNGNRLVDCRGGAIDGCGKGASRGVGRGENGLRRSRCDGEGVSQGKT